MPLTPYSLILAKTIGVISTCLKGPFGVPFVALRNIRQDWLAYSALLARSLKKRRSTDVNGTLTAWGVSNCGSSTGAATAAPNAIYRCWRCPCWVRAAAAEASCVEGCLCVPKFFPGHGDTHTVARVVLIVSPTATCSDC